MPDLPPEWPQIRAKFLFTHSKDIVGQHHAEFKRLSLTMNGVLPRSKASVDGLQPTSFEGYQILREGELVFKLIDLENTSTSRVGLSADTGLVSPAYVVLTPNPGVEARYFYYVFMDMYWRHIFNQIGNGGVRSALGPRDLLNVRLPVPPQSTQRQIADYLDSESAKIDALSAELTGFAESLRTWQRSVIAECVTKGVPSRRAGRAMKPSGINWIGEVPDGWDAVPAKRLFARVRENGQTGDEVVTCFRDGQVTLRKNRRTEGFTEATDYSGYQHVEPGQLVIHQMDAAWGAIGVSDSSGQCTPVYTICDPLVPLAPRYFALQLRLMASSGWILALSRGTRERSSGFAFPVFAQQLLARPPLKEQEEILDYLDAELAKSSALQVEIDNQLNVLKAFRKSLISEAVAGEMPL